MPGVTGYTVLQQTATITTTAVLPVPACPAGSQAVSIGGGAADPTQASAYQVSSMVLNPDGSGYVALHPLGPGGDVIVYTVCANLTP
ncbi:hypothetical protein [Streptomyces laurentii]|uniref:hypothetical protein n=1 Tax=Streptomyces laurentii TaxID=39478 RepID=UPI003694B61C